MVKDSYYSTISSKGQVTVPLEIRHRLGLRVGDRVEFVIDNDKTIVRPARQIQTPFEEYVGILPAFKGKQQINEWVAGLREDDQD